MNDEYKIKSLAPTDWPALLHEIPDPPQKLFVRGALPSGDVRMLAVVGSRKCSTYGKDVCERLISGLAGYPVCIVSGLALGIDAIAHESALRADLPTIAIPGSGLSDEALYPRAHLGLSRKIIASGGALMSEFEPNFKATDWSFPQRNRIMAGISHAVLIIEASEKSGTLITARLGMEYNRNVLIVPGPIFSPFYEGSNALLRVGAEAITSSENILDALGIPVVDKKISTDTFPADVSENERRLLELLSEPLSRDDLIRTSGMPAHTILILLSTLEIKGIIVERLGKIERIR